MGTVNKNRVSLYITRCFDISDGAFCETSDGRAAKGRRYCRYRIVRAELAETLGSKNKLRDTYLETSFRRVRFSDFVHLTGLSTGLASSFAYLRAYM
jgi:hypothetical protein